MDRKEYYKQYRLKNLEKIRQRDKNRQPKKTAQLKIWRTNNPNKVKAIQDRYIDKNREIIIEREKNRIRNKEVRRNYEKRKYKNDLIFKLSKIIRKNTRRILKGEIIVKNDYLGCDIDTLKNYLESRFLPGMTWANYGKYGWHIDHIIPLSAMKDGIDLELIGHYTNLQPLWAVDNLKKGAKYDNK